MTTSGSNWPSTNPNYPSRISTPHNVPNAALIGASAAFARPTPKPQILTKSYSGSNGALSAAKSVNSGSQTRRPSITTSKSIDDRFAHDIDREVLTLETGRAVTSTSISLSPSPAPRDNGSPSPSPSFSFLAANIAAASRPRLPSPLRSVDNWDVNGIGQKDIESGTRTTAPRQRRKSERDINMGEEHHPRNGTSRMAEELTDATSIAPTTSLVKLFEQQSSIDYGGRSGAPPSRGKPSRANGKPPPIVSPKPQRNIPLHSVSPELERPILKPSPGRASTVTTEPAKADLELEHKSRPMPVRAATIQSKNTITGKLPYVPSPQRMKPEDFKIPKVASVSAPPQHRLTLPRNQQLPYSHSPTRSDLPTNPKRPSPAPYQDKYMKNISPHITGDSLANAIVGANLAIKHNSPPSHISKTPPPIPAPRRKRDHDRHGLLHRSRSLSPQKKGNAGRMLQTLRPDPEGDEEKEKLKKHKFRHPNKHNEATRLRWQDKVSDEELKRYEGVWASNKGIFIQDPKGANDVLGIVVREIWGRSGLPTQRLAGIWDLVVKDDGRGAEDVGRLNREQFVVGMYFIDMVLRGRNLPQSVSGSVWDSVRGNGLHIAIKRK